MAASKLKKVLSIALVGLMLTPIVSFATNDTGKSETTVEAKDSNTTQNATTNTTTTASKNDGGIEKKETGIDFIDKTKPNALPTEGLKQTDVDNALDYLIASETERKALAYKNAKATPKADKTLESKFDTSKTIEGHVYVAESSAYELYLEEESLSILIRDKKTGVVLRSTLSDEEAYVRCTQAQTFSMLTSGLTIVPIKYDPNANSRSGMYDKGNVQASSRDASITYDKIDGGFLAHIDFDNHKNDLALTGLNIQFDLKVVLSDSGLSVSIPDESIQENYDESKLCFFMGDVDIFPMLGYTDRGDTGGYMILPDGNGITVNYADFYQDGIAKYKSGYSGRVYGTDVSFDDEKKASDEQEREDYNPVEDIIAPYFGMVHDNSALNKGSHADDIAVLGMVVNGEYGCMIKGNFNGVGFIFENYAYTTVQYRQFYQQPTDNKSTVGLSTVSDILTKNFEVVYMFTSGDEANYSGLANECRDLLIERGILKESDDTDYDVRIDFLGLDKENFLLFRRNVVATTIENVEQIIEELKTKGVDKISAYYDGWQKDGMYNLPNTEFKVDGDLGGNKDMKNLAEKYKDSDISISLIQNVLEINDTTSNSTFTAMKLVNKRTYSYTDRFLNVYKTFKYLTPGKTNEYIKELANNFQDENMNAIAFSGFTDTLFSYSLSNVVYSRLDAMNYYTSALEEVVGKGMDVSLIEPSMYLWKYTDKYLDMPISSSMYVFTSEDIPFLSSVLRGSIKVYSEYVNYEANQTEFFLKLIETGVYPSFLLTYESPTVLQYTNSSWDYSSYYEQYMDVITEFNDTLKVLNEKTEGAKIIKHEIDYDGITDLNKVTYSNGVVVYVNYSEESVSADGTTIDGLSYVDKVGEN